MLSFMSFKEITSINLRYNNTEWEPKVSAKFRAKLLKMAEKEAERLEYRFLGKVGYVLVNQWVYYYPIYGHEPNEIQGTRMCCGHMDDILF